MRRLAIAFALLAACATSGEVDLSSEPTLGALLPAATARSEALVVAGPGQTLPAVRVRFRGIAYEVGVDAQRRIRYIETTDRRFVTREGLRVGSTLAEVLAAGGGEPRYEAGWGRTAPLQSGWVAFFPAVSEGTPQVLSFCRR